MINLSIKLLCFSDAHLFSCSGNTHDDMLLAKIETVYTGSGDPAASSMVECL